MPTEATPLELELSTASARSTLRCVSPFEPATEQQLRELLARFRLEHGADASAGEDFLVFAAWQAQIARVLERLGVDPAERARVERYAADAEASAHRAAVLGARVRRIRERDERKRARQCEQKGRGAHENRAILTEAHGRAHGG